MACVDGILYRRFVQVLLAFNIAPIFSVYRVRIELSGGVFNVVGEANMKLFYDLLFSFRFESLLSYIFFPFPHPFLWPKPATSLLGDTVLYNRVFLVDHCDREHSNQLI